VLGARPADALAVGAGDGLAGGWEADELSARAAALTRARRLHDEALHEARAETRRIEASLALKGADAERADAEMEALLAGAPVGIAVLDRQLRYVRINRAMASFKGLPAEAFLGRTVGEMMPEQAETLEPLFGRLLETGEPCLEHETVMRVDERRYLGSYFPVRIAGEIVGIAALVLDYTDRQRVVIGLDLLARATEALMGPLGTRSRVACLARLLAPELGDFCAVYLTGEDGEVRLAETFAVDPEGVAPARATHATVQVVRTGKPALWAEVTDVSHETIAADAEDLARLRRAGVRLWLCVPLGVRGRILGAIALWRSTSRRRYDQADLALAEELARRAAMAIENAQLFDLVERERRGAEEANRLKDELLANLSHELRTPLTAILGWTRILRTHKLAEEKRARALAAVERNALAQLRLVEDLLDISRIIAHKLILEIAAVDAALVIETAIEAARPGAEGRGLHLRSVIDGHVGPLAGDAERLRQVVANLLSNAVKFTRPGGSIEVRLERDGAAARISVVDTGQGIRADFLPFVFDRFRQADGGITRSHGGLGLGLAIARHLVELHGGTIDVHSAGEGLGATFCIRLPLTPSRISPPAGGDAVASLPDLGGVGVLLASDEADTCALVTSAIEASGGQVEAVAGAAEARAAMARVVPDVLLVDLELPGDEALALGRELRALPFERGGHARAVALTAGTGVAERTRALRAGFDLHVAKPIDPAELIAAVASVSGRV
jgi:PAS domain S-box-containing protein